MKKKSRVTVLLALAAMFIFSGSDSVRAEDDFNFTNLIIFARFADEDEFIDDVYEGTTVREITDNSYNSAEYNVSDYYRNVSDGRLRMKSVYLFDNGGSVKLSHQRGYYAEYSDTNNIGYTDAGEAAVRMYELKHEWADAVNAAISAGNVISDYNGSKTYSFDELDKDGNGTIDSITIIYKNTTQSNITVSWSSPLWNYMDYADYVEISTGKGNIKSSRYVQLTNSYARPDGDSNGYLFRDSNDRRVLSIAAATHEMGHVMGLLDLYNSSNSSPVYYMSLMAKHISPVPQFISVKEKEVLGWVHEGDIETLVADGKYNLRALGTSEGNGVIGYKLDIPDKGKTLYLEYRNFEADGNKYDSQYKTLYKMNGNKVDRIPMKSGLVCYLIDTDTKFPSNMNFSSPRWNYEVLGGTYNTKSDAALAEGEDISVYSDIYIEVESIEDNTLTFRIEGDFKEHIHTGGEATCVKRAVCSVCHNEYGELNPDNHKNTFIKGAADATCRDNGYTGDMYCKDCDKVISQGSVTDRIPHQLKYVEAKAATAANEGNTEYYFCQICSGYFADDKAAREIELEDTVTAKLKPSITEGNNASVDASAAVAATFRSDAAYSDFIRVEVDGRQLVENKEFSVREGSIIITLKPEFIKGLSAGRHTLEIVSASGTAATDFTVVSGGSQQEPTTAAQEPTTAPQETTAAAQETTTAAQEPTTAPQEPTTVLQDTKTDVIGISDVKDGEVIRISHETETMYTVADWEASSGGNVSSPDTGDNSHAGVWAAVGVILSGLLVGGMCFKKKQP